jgi:DNA-binding LytR/AlgR family response regulator
MNCILIEDEKLARDLVENYVSKVSYLNLKGTFKSAIEALKFSDLGQIDLIITDIHMPDLLGTEFIKSLPHKGQVIFTTAYSKYAIEGFELEATDYLLKPFSFERFLTAINKAKTKFDTQSSSGETPKFKDKHLTIKADHKLYKVPYDDIQYIEGMREYVSFYIKEKRITALMSLKSLEEKLPHDTFVRCHKSFIVNKNLVSVMEGSNLIIGQKTIPIGQSYKNQVITEIF